MIAKPLLFWVNEGLMTLFFLVVGLELKRESLEHTGSWLSHALLPGIAACGGMIVPALIYAAINYADPVKLNGWAIPVATDIAFALAVLSLFGKRVPVGLKVFLLSLAIFDDLGAIIIIAVSHTQALSLWSLFFAALFIVALIILNVSGVRKLFPYLFLGLLLWLTVLQSGIHATIAGAVLGMIIPANAVSDERISPLRQVENTLHPFVAYLVMPLFALANAGVSFASVNITQITDTVMLGIIAGLFLGKIIGVLLFSWIVVRCGLARLPKNTNWFAMSGIGFLCGVGFTMSLFLGTLAFQRYDHFLTEVRLGVLSASILSAIVGSCILHVALQKGSHESE